MNIKNIPFINNIINIIWDDNYFNEKDMEVSRKLLMLNFVLIAFVIFVIPFVFINYLQGLYIPAILNLIVVTLVSLALFAYRKTKNYKIFTYILISILGTHFLFLLFTTGVDNSGPLWSYLYPVFVMFMLGRNQGSLFVAGYVLIISIMFIFFIPSEVYSTDFKLRFLGSFLAISILSYYIEFIRDSIHKRNEKNNLQMNDFLIKLERNEAALKEKELRYRTLFEVSNDAIFLMNDKVFLDCNPKTLEMFGCKKEEIINQSPTKFSPRNQPDGLPSVEKAMGKISDTLEGKPQFFEWVHSKLDGTIFYAEVSLVLIEIEKSKLIQASVRDITTRKIAEEELIIAKNRAEKSDRLKSDFLAQMSHEIRTPINTIMNYTSLLKMEFEDRVSEDNTGSFKSIENAAIRLLRTIDLILNISDLEAGTYEPKFEKTNIEEHVIVPVVNEFKQAAQNKNLLLKYSRGNSNSIITYLDNYTVYQTLANLLDNAIKYTEEGEILVSLDRTDNHIIITITDTGVGIREDYIPNLFEKFSQEEAGYTRRYEGSGLGLALVKEYCEINKIDLAVESKKGVGTTFKLKVPISNNINQL